MKKIFRVVLICIIILVLAGASIISYVIFALPDIPVTDLKVEITPRRLERGEYLANHVMGCLGCHAQRDWTRFSAPFIRETVGTGGEHWNEWVNFPGDLVSKNITPVHLGTWTDGEIFRAITSGVSKNGKPLFPIMPYKNYGRLSKEDIYSVIAYLRSLEPKGEEQPASRVDFPLNIIEHLMPQKGTFDLNPDSSDPVKKGEYLITAAACFDCHTQQKKGQYLTELAYAGGFEFKLPTGGVVRSANLTPDPETGLGKWTKEQFLARFKAYDDSTFVPRVVKEGTFNTAMPWQYYGTMKEEDLASIWDYLHSLEPIRNEVVKFTPPGEQ
jgi:hypothetical protein